MDPYCAAVNKPHGLNLSRGKPEACGPSSLLWTEDVRGKKLSSTEKRAVLEAFGGIDAKVLARITPPFSYETFSERGPQGQQYTRYRIRDANDDALASSYDKVYADLIVAALNQYMRTSRK